MIKIEINDLLEYYYISSPSYSPNGRNRAFVVARADKESNAYKKYIYIMRDNKPIQLTTFGKESNFIFLDDDTILFPSNREEKKDDSFTETIFYTINLNGGEAKEAFRVPFITLNFEYLTNGKYLMQGSYLTKYPDYYKASSDDQNKIKKEIDENKDYREIEETPYVSNGSGFTNGERVALFIFDSKNNVTKRITENYLSVYDFSLSLNKKEAFFLGTKFIHTTKYTDVHLYHLDLSSLDYKQIELPTNLIPGMALYGTDFAYLALTNQDRIGGNSNQDFYIIDKNFQIKKIKDFDYSIGSSVISDIEGLSGSRNAKVYNDELYFTTTVFERGPIFKLSKDGVITKYYENNGSVTGFDVFDHHLFMTSYSDMLPIEIYDEKERLSFFNDEILKDRYLAKPESLRFTNEANDEIHGFILKPINYKPGLKYPVILDIHGGPKAAYGEVFFHEMQVWASMGYFVIYANPTGSDGRGDRFSNIRGKYGTIDYNDLMTFTDKCLEKYPDMDKMNLFETGGSYGGFMTNWIIGHTDRFRACASQRSISNWSIMTCISDIGIEFTYDQQLSDPWRNPEKCWWHSPLKYADHVLTPTLFIHSDEDYRCPLQEGLSMFTALRTRNIDTKIIVFKGENHELSRSGKPLHRIKRLQEITNWFENHRTK